MKLRELRLSRFLSIRELAARASVAPRTIVEAESGRRIPYFATARKIADALGVEPGEIDEFAARADPNFVGKEAA